MNAETILDRWRSQCPEGFDARVKILTVRSGYAHCLYEGTCDPTVTVEDIAKLFAHPMFGGRNVWVNNGRFSIIRHTD